MTGALANFANSVVPAQGQAPAPEEEAAPPVEQAPAPEEQAAPPKTLPITGAGTNLLPLWIAIFALLTGGLLLLVSRKRRGLPLWILGGAVLFSASMIGQSSFALAQPDSGIIRAASPYSVDETVTRLQSEIETQGLRSMATVNHAANATNVDRTLSPTQVILFGNPNAGTPLMQSNQTIGIDLPQKMLVWEDSGGSVFVDYNDPAYLGRRHNITDKDQVLTNIAGVLQGIVAAATSE